VNLQNRARSSANIGNFRPMKPINAFPLIMMLIVVVVLIIWLR
jgi:hypothetical protein